MDTARESRICYFYKDGDENQVPVRFNVNPSHYKNLDILAIALQNKFDGLPNGVRSIYTPRGKDRITKLEQLDHNGHFIVSSHRNKAKGVDISKPTGVIPWRGGRSPDRAGINELIMLSRKENPMAKTLPKKVEIFLNGDPSQKHVLLLNRRMAQSFDALLEDIGQIFKITAKKLFTTKGKSVTSLSAIFNGPDTYVISQDENFTPLDSLSYSPKKWSEGIPVYGRKKAAISRRINRKSIGKIVQYEIRLFTGEVLDKGNVSSIYINLHGQNGETGVQHLTEVYEVKELKNGKGHVFTLEAMFLENLYYVTVGYEGITSDQSVYLEKVEVIELPAAKIWIFPCKRWLVGKKESGSTEYKLSAVESIADDNIRKTERQRPLKLQHDSIERWKVFASFKRTNHVGTLVMKGVEGIVDDILPGQYSLAGLTNFHDLPKIEPKHATVVGVRWISSTVPTKSGRALFPESFDGKIPVELATREHLSYYGATLATGNDDHVSLSLRHCVQDFTYLHNYLDDYVTEPQALGGAGIEKHEFSHYDCPLEDDSGIFLIAKWDEEKELHITGFKVPKHHTLYVPGGLIHSNDYLRGTWRTMLSDEHIDHVQLYRLKQSGKDNEYEKFTFQFV